MKRVLNLYAGVGGNRLKWDDPEVRNRGYNIHVTAVEFSPEIAEVYKDLYPQDEVIVADAHAYLLEHYKEFDFIWSSPPCQSHSQIRYRLGYLGNPEEKQFPAKYPDMKLYEEIIMLQYWYKGLWVVENTIPYYPPLIEGNKVAGHIWWSNFKITPFEHGNRNHKHGTIQSLQERKQINLDKYKIGNKRQILRNCVEPEVGKHVFLCAQQSAHPTKGILAASQALSTPQTLFNLEGLS